MAQQQECGYCQPHWTLRDLRFTLGKARIIPTGSSAGDLSWPVMMHYRACLDKLTCVDGGGGTAPEIKVPKISFWDPHVAPGAPPTSMGAWMPGPALNSKLAVKFKGMIDETQKKVCCRGFQVAGNIGGRWLNCCDAKREIICDCYARQGTPGQPAPSADTIEKLTKSCCFTSPKQGIEIPLYIILPFRADPYSPSNTDFIANLLNDPSYWKGDLETKLQIIGSRGAGPLSCTGSGGVGNQFNPIESPILSTWGQNCICDQADKCP